MRYSAVTLASVVFLIAPAIAAGADKWWYSTSGGNWQTATNWYLQSPPGASDTARFYLQNNGTVTFGADASVDMVWLGNNGPGNDVAARFDLSGGRTLTTNSLYLSYQGSLYISDGDLVIVGGRVLANTYASVDMSSVLTLQDGGTLSTPRYLSASAAGTGGFRSRTKILGGGKLSAGTFDAAGSGFSAVEINGGVLDTDYAELGSAYPGASHSPDSPYTTMSVSGAGSTWLSSSEIAILGDTNSSYTDYARLTVENGGKIINGGRLYTTTEGQVHLLAGGLIETNSAAFANGTFTHTGGTLRIDAANPAAGQPNPGTFDVGNATYLIEGAGSPILEFANGASDRSLETVDVGGNGRINVVSGSTVTTTTARINDLGVVEVSGTGSRWTSPTFNVNGGINGGGRLIVADGGVVAANQFSAATLDLQPGGRLQANVVGSSFTFSGAGTVNVGTFQGTTRQKGGILEIGSPAGATVAQSIYILESGTIEFEIRGRVRETEYDCLKVASTLSFKGGTLKVTLPTGFVPVPGDRFDLLDFSGTSALKPAVELPALPAGAGWNVSQLFTTGELLVNHAPTATTITPVVVECAEGHNVVKLSTVVDDLDSNALRVTWYVDGVVKLAQANAVRAGDTVEFEYDYPHGAHEVQLKIDDFVSPAFVGTTVTVTDTTSPTVAVAADVIAATDAGKSYASGVVLSPPVVEDNCDLPPTLVNDAPATYSLGETIVTWTATDADGNFATAKQKVIVEDRERPKFSGTSQIKLFCDPGKLFSTRKLPEPAVSDNVDDASTISIASDAPPRFPIGKTTVHFTATDSAGNAATWPMDVIVVNRKPRADAGKDVAITTKSEKGADVSLDGSRSSDPDKHKLKYAWKAKGVKFAHATTAKPSGIFPVGKTVVTLTVTDAGGLKHKDTVTVTVKLKNGRSRSQGSDANRSFELAAQQAGSGVAAEAGGGAAFAALAYSQAATAYGDAAGEFVRWEEGQSEDDALLSYAELRAMQAAHGEAAASALLSAYAETGDESLLSAYGYAAYGTAYAAADLSER